MLQDFLTILRCPECQSGLTLDPPLPHAYTPTRPHALPEGRLTCPSGHIFLVKGGIPRFVPDEQYAGSFGLEWNLFDRTQLDPTPHQPSPIPHRPSEGVSYPSGLVARKGQESHDAFYYKTGLKREELRGKRVLDAGCGTGRFAAVAAEAGADVVACDLSLAVEACQKNLGDQPNVQVLQADIFRLPFAPESFDVIYSLGVLHHTPDTRKAFLCLPPFLKPGGKLCVWVYDKQTWRGIFPPYYFMSDILRRWTVRWPTERLLQFARFRARLYPLVRIPVLGILFERLWPGSVHPDYEWRVLDTLDWYSPVYQWKHTDEELADWFAEAGLAEVTKLPFPVSAWGVKRNS